MTPADFSNSTSAAHPPAGLAAPARSAVVGRQGRLGQGAQDRHGRRQREAAWVHAYLHRVEGDLPNAGYWYRTAGKPVATGALEAEWSDAIARVS